jgi:hypothetical protein
MNYDYEKFTENLAESIDLEGYMKTQLAELEKNKKDSFYNRIISILALLVAVVALFK